MRLYLTHKQIIAVTAAQAAIAAYKNAESVGLRHADISESRRFKDGLQLRTTLAPLEEYEVDVDFRTDAEFDFFLELRKDDVVVGSFWLDWGVYGAKLLKAPTGEPREL